ncbi:MAG: hypothetical protein K9M55_11785 [Candidatus Marinimicrobia bacterium]|nr:hypothetical protein [Candidatus Neomarinimicrobiota bacterium]
MKSEETYLLVPQRDLNVKIRNQIFDVKQKLKVNSDGLEQWLPILKVEFPMSQEAFKKIAALLGLQGHPLGDSLSELDFISAMGLESTISPVRLTKMREKYELQGVAGEFTHLQIGKKNVFTIAFEHVDAKKIGQIRNHLAIEDLMNENYPQALKRLMGIVRGVS